MSILGLPRYESQSISTLCGHQQDEVARGGSTHCVAGHAILIFGQQLCGGVHKWWYPQ